METGWYDSYGNFRADYGSETPKPTIPEVKPKSDDIFGLTDKNWSSISSIGNLGLGALSVWNSMENRKLAKDTFNFNKEMKTKEYDLAKADWDKRVARSDGLAAALSSGYGSVSPGNK